MAGRFRELFIKPYVKEAMADGTKQRRSSKWPKVRAEKIEEDPYCANCGKHFKYLRKYRLQVHHKKPFHLYPEKELDKDNLICLCGNPRCHLDKGHLGDFKSYNEDVEQDCMIWRLKYEQRP